MIVDIHGQASASPDQFNDSSGDSSGPDANPENDARFPSGTGFARGVTPAGGRPLVRTRGRPLAGRGIRGIFAAARGSRLVFHPLQPSPCRPAA